jgi:hypothetical protein
MAKRVSEKAALAALPALSGPAGKAKASESTADQRIYLCIGPNTWGRGTTPAEAVKNAKANFSRSLSGSWKWIMYDAQADAVIDDMGSICYMPINRDDYAASVAATTDAGLSDGASNHPKGKFYVTNAEPAGNEPKSFDIPDEPYDGEPDNDQEMREHDDWMNNEVYTLSERKS